MQPSDGGGRAGHLWKLAFLLCEPTFVKSFGSNMFQLVLNENPGQDGSSDTCMPGMCKHGFTESFNKGSPIWQMSPPRALAMERVCGHTHCGEPNGPLRNSMCLPITWEAKAGGKPGHIARLKNGQSEERIQPKRNTF